MEKIFCIFLFQILLSNGLQDWLEQPGYTEVNPGGETVLGCRVSNKKGECRWERNSQPVGMYKGKIEWAGNREEGDCSLRVLAAELQYDNGDWVCQVTASSFHERDTLISNPAKLVVRVAPARVYLRVPGEMTGVQGDLVAAAGEELEVECVAEGGNPAPQLVWYFGSKVWEGRGEVLEEGAEKEGEISLLVSRVRIPVSREDHGAEVRCEVRHEALVNQETMKEEAVLDIHYPPRNHIEPLETENLSEGDPVRLVCSVSANPPAEIEWIREGTGELVSKKAELIIPALSREHSDTYMCQARNSLGLSAPRKIPLSVKYPPVVKSVGPALALKKMVGDEVELTCTAEGFPVPTYTWIQLVDKTEVIRGESRILHLPKINYKDQGVFICQAENTIKGVKSISRSETISLEVEGSPVLDSKESNHYVVTGTDARVEIEFCADPQPEITWIRVGVEEKVLSHDGEDYSVEEVAQGPRQDCYISALTVLNPSKTETHEYVLKLKNPHGEESHVVNLRVGEVYSQETLIGGVIGGCVTIVLILSILVFSCKRCCSTDKKIKQDIERNV